MSNKKMLPIWFFVGLMLTVMGIIITITGINYAFNPQTRTALAHLNPNLWWGIFTLVVGLLFLVPAILHHNSNNQ